MTRGRTQASRDIPIEALVRATADALRYAGGLGRDRQMIIHLCNAQIQSLAELAAHLDRPIGVVRVLLADMASDGLVFIDEAAALDDGEVSVALLERVLSGLHNL
jgi:hypothetical protein